MPRIMAGVMGPGEGAAIPDCENAYKLGQAIAALGWVVLTGGRGQGVMDAACRGAKRAGGTTVGILPGADRAGISTSVEIAIVTGLGQARNNLNVLSSDVVFVCGMGAGTAAEASLALKAQRPVVLVDPSLETERFFVQLAGDRVHIARDVAEAVRRARSVVDEFRARRRLERGVPSRTE